jgi:hypothetical protein
LGTPLKQPSVHRGRHDRLGGLYEKGRRTNRAGARKWNRSTVCCSCSGEFEFTRHTLAQRAFLNSAMESQGGHTFRPEQTLTASRKFSLRPGRLAHIQHHDSENAARLSLCRVVAPASESSRWQSACVSQRQILNQTTAIWPRLGALGPREGRIHVQCSHICAVQTRLYGLMGTKLDDAAVNWLPTAANALNRAQSTDSWRQ